MRLAPEVLAAAGLALGIVVDRRHDRLYQDGAAGHGTVTHFIDRTITLA
jgi:hypothetical protein